MEHLIPLTPSIVLKVDKRRRCLVINPPEGLLELGRQQSLLKWLKPQLEVRKLRDAVLVFWRTLKLSLLELDGGHLLMLLKRWLEVCKLWDAVLVFRQPPRCWI